jgi:aspartate kinase
MKFGGTSVGSTERFADVAKLVKNTWAKGETPVVVLSAMSGVTNGLIACAQLAEKGELQEALHKFEDIRKRHASVIKELFSKQKHSESAWEELHPFFANMEILLQGVGYLKELSPRSLDAISGLGELLSSKIFARFLNDCGQEAVWLDARQFMLTDENFGQATPLWNEINVRARGLCQSHLDQKRVIVTQGFIGATLNGISTTLGRGGSDYSASIIGVALDAKEIQIWTDVDGMMTADPRLVPEAKALSEVSFHEASELAYFGAKVLHPLTIAPAVAKNIPVRILNTMRPESKGTAITANAPAASERANICSIASKKSLTAIFIRSNRMLMTHGFLAKVFDIFARYETPIDLIATSEVSISLTTDKVDQLPKITRDLEDLGDEIRILNDVAIVSVVGQHFRESSGLAGRVFSALQDINVIMISYGASDLNLSFVVATGDADRAVKYLHRQFFEAEVVASH